MLREVGLEPVLVSLGESQPSQKHPTHPGRVKQKAANPTPPGSQAGRARTRFRGRKRPRGGKFAPMAVHLALLLSLLGNTVGLVFGASSEVLIEEGGYADVGQAENRRVVMQKGEGPQFALVVLLISL